MPAVSAEQAGREIQTFISGLNAPKHNAREKAIKVFRSFVERQGVEFYDDDVDAAMLGDGYTLGLVQWCGERSTGTHGALKRTAANAISALKWLVSLRDPSGEENIFLSRFLQVPIEDLQKMHLDLHVLPTPAKGAKAAGRGGKYEEACELISLILQHHRNDAGDPEEVSLEELLHAEAARKIFIEWLSQTAMGKQDTPTALSGGGSGGRDGRRQSAGGAVAGTGGSEGVDSDGGGGGGEREGLGELLDEDAPLTWAEVDQKQFSQFTETDGPVVHLDTGASRLEGPVPDPLGLKQVDLRVYQKTFIEEDDRTGAAGRTEKQGEVDWAGTLQAKRRALLGQRDRLKLLRKMQTGRQRVRDKMGMRGRSPGRGRRGSLDDPAVEDEQEEGAVGDGGQGGEEKEQAPSVVPRRARDDVSFSVVPTMQSFDPGLFMSVVHANASFDDLHDGLGRLHHAKANQASELQHLVRDHFDNFVRCADSIEKYATQIDMELSNNSAKKEAPVARPQSLAQLRMQLKAEREAEDKRAKAGLGSSSGRLKGGAGPAAKSHLRELTNLMEGAQTEAGKNFSQLLDKLDKIKQVRAAQHLLAEKGSILDIPREMKLCVKDGCYSELVQLYKKAHTAYSSSILKQVRAEAEAVGKQACARLIEVLKSPQVTLEEQTAAVGHLHELEYTGEDPLQMCFDSQKEHFMSNLSQCREAFAALLLEAYSEKERGNNKDKARTKDRPRPKPRRVASRAMPAQGGLGLAFNNGLLRRSNMDAGSMLSPPSSTGVPVGAVGLSGLGSISDSHSVVTDPEDMSPSSIGLAGSSGFSGVGGSFFDMHLTGEKVLRALDDSDDESLAGTMTKMARDEDPRLEGMGMSMAQAALEVEGMDLDEDLAIPAPKGIDALTHRISVARLQHISNLSWCLGSWLPHLTALGVYLIKVEHSKRGGRHGQDDEDRQASPSLQMKKVFASGQGRSGGLSDYGDGDTSVASGQRPPSLQEGTSVADSEDGSLSAARRERIFTMTEIKLTESFTKWLINTTKVLRKAIFGDDQSKQTTSGDAMGADGRGKKGRGSLGAGSDEGDEDATMALLFTPHTHPTLAHAYKHHQHLKQPLDPRYLRKAFSSLSTVYDRLSGALGSSWEGDGVLNPGLRSLEKLVKEAQGLYVRSEMEALGKEARELADAETWLGPEPPDPPGGTRLPRVFAALAQQRMEDLVGLLPRAEWSAAEVTAGLGSAVELFLECILALATRAYESSRMDSHTTGTAMASGLGGVAGGKGGTLSPDHQLLSQVGNCLQLEATILPELWESGMGMFDVSTAGLAADRQRTQKVQDKVMNKYLKRKYRVLKIYIKNGWWGYAKPTATGGQGTSSNASPSKRDSLGGLSPDKDKGVDGTLYGDQQRRTSIARHRTSLALKSRTKSGRASIASSPSSMATVARQASALTVAKEKGAGTGSGNSRRMSVDNRRTSMKAALNIVARAPSPQALPSYLVKVLLSLVQARLEAQEALGSLAYRKAGTYEGKFRKAIVFSDYVLRESARQVMEIVCDCANARVVGKGHLGTKRLDGSDPIEQAEKIAQVEFLRDALYRYLPSATLERVNRVIARVHAGSFEGKPDNKPSTSSTPDATQDKGASTGTSAGVSSGGVGGAHKTRDSLERVSGVRRNSLDRPQSTSLPSSAQAGSRDSLSKKADGEGAVSGPSKPSSISDTLGAAMPGTFLTAMDLQEKARVYVVCLK